MINFLSFVAKKSFPVFLFGMMMFFLQLEVPCFPTVRFGLCKNRLGESLTIRNW